MLTLASQSNFQHNPLIRIYQQAIELLHPNSNNGDAYRALKTLTIEHFLWADADERINLFALLINVAYCSLSPANYVNEGFELYKEAVKCNWLVENGYISADHFHNVVDAACGVGDFEWAEAFIQRCTRLLDTRKDKRREVKKLFRARIAFRKGGYEQVIRWLERLKFGDFPYESRRYTLLIRSYYKQYLHFETASELSPMDDALDALDEKNRAYRAYLRKQHRNHEVS